MKLPLIINEQQKPNSLVSMLKVPDIEWSKTLTCDYALGNDTAVLFLSLKFHLAYPEYFIARLKAFTGTYPVRILLLLVDKDNPDQAISNLTTMAIANSVTTILGFSYEECARWLTNMYVNQESTSDDLKAVNESALETAIEAIHALGLSRKDAESMLAGFSSISDCILASKEEISQKTKISDSKIALFKASISQIF